MHHQQQLNCDRRVYHVLASVHALWLHEDLASLFQWVDSSHLDLIS